MRPRIYFVIRKIANSYFNHKSATTTKMVDRGRCVELWQDRRVQCHRWHRSSICRFFVISCNLWFVLFRSFSNFACDLSFVDERVRSHAPVDSMTPLPMNWIPDNSSVICGRGRDAYNHSTLIIHNLVGELGRCSHWTLVYCTHLPINLALFNPQLEIEDSGF